jgi:hypothetical protein
MNVLTVFLFKTDCFMMFFLIFDIVDIGLLIVQAVCKPCETDFKSCLAGSFTRVQFPQVADLRL